MRASAGVAALVMLVGCGPAPKPQSESKLPAQPPVRITHFYASPPVLEPGERATVCYGVENARAVRLDPPVEEVRPAYNRCFQVAPARDTTYTLVAEGHDGKTVSASFELKVPGARPARKAPPRPEPLIEEFTATPPETAPGGRITVCYAVAENASVQLQPDVERPPGPRACFSVSLRQTTTYTLTVTDPSGRSETRSLTVKVR